MIREERSQEWLRDPALRLPGAASGVAAGGFHGFAAAAEFTNGVDGLVLGLEVGAGEQLADEAER